MLWLGAALFSLINSLPFIYIRLKGSHKTEAPHAAESPGRRRAPSFLLSRAVTTPLLTSLVLGLAICYLSDIIDWAEAEHYRGYCMGRRVPNVYEWYGLGSKATEHPCYIRVRDGEWRLTTGTPLKELLESPKAEYTQVTLGADESVDGKSTKWVLLRLETMTGWGPQGVGARVTKALSGPFLSRNYDLYRQARLVAVDPGSEELHEDFPQKPHRRYGYRAHMLDGRHTSSEYRVPYAPALYHLAVNRIFLFDLFGLLSNNLLENMPALEPPLFGPNSPAARAKLIELIKSKAAKQDSHPSSPSGS